MFRVSAFTDLPRCVASQARTRAACTTRARRRTTCAPPAPRLARATYTCARWACRWAWYPRGAARCATTTRIRRARGKVGANLGAHAARVLATDVLMRVGLWRRAEWRPPASQCTDGPNACSSMHPCTANSTVCTSGTALAVINGVAHNHYCSLDMPPGAAPNGAAPRPSNHVFCVRCACAPRPGLSRRAARCAGHRRGKSVLRLAGGVHVGAQPVREQPSVCGELHHVQARPSEGAAAGSGPGAEPARPSRWRSAVRCLTPAAVAPWPPARSTGPTTAYAAQVWFCDLSTPPAALPNGAGALCYNSVAECAVGCGAHSAAPPPPACSAATCRRCHLAAAAYEPAPGSAARRQAQRLRPGAQPVRGRQHNLLGAWAAGVFPRRIVSSRAARPR
jgi:hypothetical protein